MLKNGIYKCQPEGCNGEIYIDVKETEKQFNFEMLSNSCRYSPPNIDMLFSSGKAVIKKFGGKHAMRFIDDGRCDGFVIYPFQCGIPFFFELIKENK